MLGLESIDASNKPAYYWQKPHYNLANKIVHSDPYKKLFPWRQRYEWSPNTLVQLPTMFGNAPQITWLWGNLDYSLQKKHRHIQAHDEWYPDRKSKTLGSEIGGQHNYNGLQSTGLTLRPSQIPKGCHREIRTFNNCKADKDEAQCFNEKISIMEVCPDFVLEGLREKKKWALRAELIDN